MAANAECLAHVVKQGKKVLSESVIRMSKVPSLGSHLRDRKEDSSKRVLLENVATACRASMRPRITLTAAANSALHTQRCSVGETRLSTPRIRRQESIETVIFLDIDGVLHSLYGNDLFKDHCCRLLSLIIRTTNASIVLSSTWRTEASKVAIINNVLKQLGLSQILDSTKFLDVAREVEICEWLDEHPHVRRWIAIDDMDLMRSTSVQSKRMEGHFVRTSSEEGLTDANAQLAIRLLLAQSSKQQTMKPSESYDAPPQHGMDKCQTRAVAALVSPLPERGRLTLLDKRLGSATDDAPRRELFKTSAKTTRALSPLPGSRVQSGMASKQLDAAPLVSPFPSFRRLVKVV